MTPETSGRGAGGTDLSKGLGCGHLTDLDHQVARGALTKPPMYFTHVLRALQEQGRDHESAYRKHLEAQGRTVVRVGKSDTGESGMEQTRRLMHEGVDVIYQAQLRDADGTWGGYADFLLRVSGTTELGDYGYEVLDTKLAADTRAGTILQLCLYSDLVGQLQGCRPEHMHVVTPGEGFVELPYRVDDFMA